MINVMAYEDELRCEADTSTFKCHIFNQFEIKRVFISSRVNVKVKVHSRSCCHAPGPPPVDVVRRGHRGSRHSRPMPTIQRGKRCEESGRGFGGGAENRRNCVCGICCCPGGLSR